MVGRKWVLQGSTYTHAEGTSEVLECDPRAGISRVVCHGCGIGGVGGRLGLRDGPENGG